jgi:ubiquinone/menaquinone biosynthesis C-methylase UbiE
VTGEGTGLFEWEQREQQDEDVAAPGYHERYHDSAVARAWDDAFYELVQSEVVEGDRVLDLGCGPASLWEHWAALPKLRSLTGVDLSPGMIDEARRRYPEGDFRVARAHELPFPDGSFDVVVVSAVLHHIPPSHLPGALAEIDRVLDEHGKLVGRDPASGHVFGRDPGWFSGAIMSFRHFVYRLTSSREFPEPALGEHHHVPDTDELLVSIGSRFTVTRAETRFPFSNYLQRVRSDAVASFALLLDDRLSDRTGAILHYVAEKNYVDEGELHRVIDLARREVDPAMSDAEFLAHLAAAAKELERTFGNKR